MKRKLLFITPGPITEMDDMKKYVELSELFVGDVITSSDNAYVLKTKRIGSFLLHSIRYKYKRSAVVNGKFLAYCLMFAIRSRVNGDKYDLVVTYDPLKTGLLGAIVAVIIGSKFAPEVNGVYTSPAVYMDIGNRFISKLKKASYPILERFVLRRADGIKILFPGQLDPFKGIGSDRTIACFHDYVDIRRFRDISVSEKYEILFVGFPFRLKGVDALIKAFKQICPKFPQWRLKILGWYPDMHELVSEIGGHGRIYHHQPVPAREIPKHVGSCSIFALPSRSEAMGKVLVEAMAAGKARVGSNIDGIPSVIDDGIDGLLFEPENVEDLADKLERLISDAGLRKRLGDAGKRRAEEEFSEEKYFENLIAFYRKVIEAG